MNRLLIDTNVILDLIDNRVEFYHDAALLFSLADKEKIALETSALTYANSHYILSRKHGDVKARAALRKLSCLVGTISLSSSATAKSLSDDDFSDFEDGLQYHSALENEIDIIISRDKKGFKNSKIPVMSAKEFIVKFFFLGE
jgi:predicted nucleic acid-binding protein